jgi:hypothetical protein
MTAQMHDQIDYADESYDLVGVEGYGLFRPYEHGLNPCFRSTACQRGYVCGYGLVENQLFLTSLRLSCAGNPPSLFGREPKVDSRLGFAYPRLRRLVPFTGRLLIATEFISGLYVHMGFQSAWKYRTVRELEFTEGRLLGETDRSEESAAQRSRMGGNPYLLPAGVDSADWIAQSFSLEFWK